MKKYLSAAAAAVAMGAFISAVLGLLVSMEVAANNYLPAILSVFVLELAMLIQQEADLRELPSVFVGSFIGWLIYRGVVFTFFV